MHPKRVAFGCWSCWLFLCILSLIAQPGLLTCAIIEIFLSQFWVITNKWSVYIRRCSMIALYPSRYLRRCNYLLLRKRIHARRGNSSHVNCQSAYPRMGLKPKGIEATSIYLETTRTRTQASTSASDTKRGFMLERGAWKAQRLIVIQSTSRLTLVDIYTERRAYYISKHQET